MKLIPRSSCRRSIDHAAPSAARASAPSPSGGTAANGARAAADVGPADGGAAPSFGRPGAPLLCPDTGLPDVSNAVGALEALRPVGAAWEGWGELGDAWEGTSDYDDDGAPRDPRAFREHVKELAPGGVDVAVDMVGGPHLEAIVRSMAFDGRCVVVGFASGDIPKVPANLLLVKNCSLVGLYWGAHAKARPDAFRESLGRVSKMWADGLVSPRVGLALPLREANAAVAALAGRKSTGKVVLTMDIS